MQPGWHATTDKVRGRDTHQFPQFIPYKPVVLALEPVADVLVQGLSKVGELREIVAGDHRLFKFIQTAVELLGQGLAGVVANHGDVHGNQIPFKGGIPAALDGVPEILPGLFTKSLHT